MIAPSLLQRLNQIVCPERGQFLGHPQLAPKVRDPSRILRDLVAATPGEEGKWFATAKEAGQLEMAAELANQSPCDPKTLIRAARGFVGKNPHFALEAGLAAIRWLAQGYGFEIVGADVWAAYSHTLKAAEQIGRRDEVRDRIRTLDKR